MSTCSLRAWLLQMFNVPTLVSMAAACHMHLASSSQRERLHERQVEFLCMGIRMDELYYFIASTRLDFTLSTVQELANVISKTCAGDAIVWHQHEWSRSTGTLQTPQVHRLHHVIRDLLQNGNV